MSHLDMGPPGDTEQNILGLSPSPTIYPSIYLANYLLFYLFLY